MLFHKKHFYKSTSYVCHVLFLSRKPRSISNFYGISKNTNIQGKFGIIYLLEIYRRLPNLILMNRFSCLLDAFPKHQQKQSFFKPLWSFSATTFVVHVSKNRKKKKEIGALKIHCSNPKKLTSNDSWPFLILPS